MTPSPSVLLAGHVTLDRHGTALVPGGAVTYCALAYAGLGARVRVVSAAGPDFPAAALGSAEVAFEPAFEPAGPPGGSSLPVARRGPGRGGPAAATTTTFENLYDAAGRRTQRVLAAAPALDPAHIPPAWREADLLHLAPILAEVDLAAFRRAVRARFTGLGVQGWVRRLEPDGAVSQPRWEPGREELAGVDAAVLGEDDLEGQGDLVGRLARHVPVVAFTHGRRGCEVIVRGRTWKVGIHPAREVDPTGAGDVFSAGFFLALAGGAPPAEAARLGAAAASICVEGLGPSALARVAEARARAALVPLLDD